jgi:anti-anti-sigma regulatory factor
LPITYTQGDDSVAIQLEGVVDIVCAAELKKSLLDALNSGKPVRVSLDQCTDFDVTGFQLLWAAAREAKSQHIDFALASPIPPPILDSLKHVGFDNFPVPA